MSGPYIRSSALFMQNRFLLISQKVLVYVCAKIFFRLCFLCLHRCEKDRLMAILISMALNSLINFRPGLLSIIMKFLLFLLHFTCEFFIVLCLALSFISNPINFFPWSLMCCHALIIMYLSSSLHAV